MSESARHHHINYIEFTSTDIEAAKKFYARVFGWTFIDYGPDYASFNAPSAGIDGGFRRGRPSQRAREESAPLTVFYSQDLKKTEAAIREAGGEIVVPIFEFPGGKRFHFSDGAGNILAVWSES